jgi:hypothetical protein
MRVITTKTKVYKFDELSENGKKQARINHAEFLSDISSSFYDDEGNVKKEYKDYFVIKTINEMEKMQTPWFFIDCLYWDYQKELDNEIRINDYEFTEGGILV